jgi:hypothetical protein
LENERREARLLKLPKVKTKKKAEVLENRNPIFERVRYAWE